MVDDDYFVLFSFLVGRRGERESGGDGGYVYT